MKLFKSIKTSSGPLLLTVVLACLASGCNVIRLRDKTLVRQLKQNDIKSYYYQGDSVTVKYWMGGEGPALLFLHGFGGNALTTFSREMKELSRDHLVIAPDLLWFGGSHSSRTPTLSAQTDAMLALLDDLNINELKIIGQSYGGFIAIDMIKRKSKEYLKVCIANCPGTTYDIAELDVVCKNFGVRTIDELFILEKPEQFQTLINLSTYKNPKMPRFVLRQTYYAYFAAHHEEQKELLSTLQKESGRISDTTFFNGIRTMVLWGEKDELFSLQEGQKFAKAIGAEFTVIPEAGHAPQADRPSKFTQSIIRFCRD